MGLCTKNKSYKTLFDLSCGKLGKFITPKFYKYLKKWYSPKPFGLTKNGFVSGRLACTSSKAEIHMKQNRNLDFNPVFKLI